MILNFAFKYAKKYNFHPALILAIIKKESEFHPTAYNRKEGAYGLMQLLKPTARMMGFNEKKEWLFDPETNIKYGTKYLDYVHKYNNTNDIKIIIGGYNAGHGSYKRYNKIINQKYVKDVLKYYDDFKTEYDYNTAFGNMLIMAIGFSLVATIKNIIWGKE